MTLEEYIKHGIHALKDRRAFLLNELSKTTNPLDRLSIKDRIEELNLALDYFSKYESVIAEEIKEK